MVETRPISRCAMPIASADENDSRRLSGDALRAAGAAIAHFAGGSDRGAEGF